MVLRLRCTERPLVRKPDPGVLISVDIGYTIRVISANGHKVTIRVTNNDAPETAQGGAAHKRPWY